MRADTMRSFLLVILVLMAATMFGAEKQRDWQTGKVLDSQRSRYFAGTVGSANTTGSAQENGTTARIREIPAVLKPQSTGCSRRS